MKRLLDLLRRNPWFFFGVTGIALALRLFFVVVYPSIHGDTFIYGDIAKNWMNHGVYGLTAARGIRPTLIRLPGYPAFLAAVFAIFGQEHYTTVMIVQAVIDTNTCLVIAALALELMNARAAKVAYLLSAVCPFTANYVAAPLTETLAIATTAHALYYGVRGIKALQSGAGSRSMTLWLVAGLWTAAGTLLRPDGGMVLLVLGGGLIVLMFSWKPLAPPLRSRAKQSIVTAGIVLLAASLLPLAPWAIRNWRTFRVFQPVVPRYANDPGEFVPGGFNLWVKTWMADSVSVEEVYWRVPGEKLDFTLLPERAFDSRQEYDRTRALFDEYNARLSVTPELDAQFERLAAERINHNPFRYYVWLPALRIADMWLRPRAELLPIETRWWQFSGHPEESAFALAWAGLNLFYLWAAWRGWLRRRLGLCGAVLIGYVLLRSAFLGTLEGPEPRYVLECFPVVLALAGGAFAAADQFAQRQDVPEYTIGEATSQRNMFNKNAGPQGPAFFAYLFT